MSTCCKGPGYATPMEAFRNGPREKLLYIPCIVPDKSRPDYLVTVDSDSESKTYSKVIHRLPMSHVGDEIHHTGWNACSSCHDDVARSRNRLILPSIGSDRIYAIDTETDPKAPRIDKEIQPSSMHAHGVGTPHTSHCLANGDIMISTMGDGPDGNAVGNFVLIDGKTFKIRETYCKEGDEKPAFGYDFWYQPYHNVMISTEFGAPKNFFTGFSMDHVSSGGYGTHLNVFDWKTGKMTQKIDLGMEGALPLEIRFLHEPKAAEGFVGCALNANVYRFFKETSGKWATEKVIDVPSKKVEGWAMPDMPGIMTDIILSMDDKFLYFSNWVHGDIRQYDVTDTRKPKLVGQIFLGGSIWKGGPVKVLEDKELKTQPELASIQGKKLRGSAQMLQLSLDGKRLYVTTSLLSPWDRQFFPDMIENGSFLLRVDVNTEKGGLTLNQDFAVDFKDEPEGAVLAHEVRYPGGDCTSDIYLAKEE
jgi:selenium-binding protein 1